MNYKMFKDWRQIIKVPWIPLCDAFNSDNLLISSFVDTLRYLLPSLPFKCPIKPGRYYEYNVTIPDIKQRKGSADDQYFKTLLSLPNGVYRCDIYVKAASDPHWYFVQTFYEIKKRMNNDKF